MRTRKVLGQAALVALGAGTILGATAPMAFARGGPGGGGGGGTITVTCTGGTDPFGPITLTGSKHTHGAIGIYAKSCESAGGTFSVTGGGEGD